MSSSMTNLKTKGKPFNVLNLCIQNVFNDLTEPLSLAAPSSYVVHAYFLTHFIVGSIDFFSKDRFLLFFTYIYLLIPLK